MPFKSQAQERFMYAKHPKIAKKWSSEFAQPKNLPEHAKPKSPWLAMKQDEGDK